MIVEIAQARVLLRQYGKHRISYYRYKQLIATGDLKPPIKRPGRRPYHTIDQIEECRARLRVTEQVNEPLWKRRL